MKKITSASLKSLTLAVILSLCATYATAQVRFGVRGGFDLVDNAINDKILDSSNRLGFQIGGVLEVMSPMLGLGAELSVLYGHQEFDVDKKDYEYSDYRYIHVPLNVKKTFGLLPKLGIFLSAGPYANFKLEGGNLKHLKKEIETQYKSKGYGIGINAGAGVKLLDKCELGMYFRKQLTDNYSDKPVSGSEIIDGLVDKPDNWSLKLSYFF